MDASNNDPDRRPTSRPTIRQVAAAAGVSKSLVSLVLRDAPHVSPARRAAVLRAVEELGYVGPGTRVASRTVGVVVNDLRNPWFVDLVDGLNTALDAEGIHVILGDGRFNRRTDEGLVRTLADSAVAGLVLVGMMPLTPGLVELAERVPTVLAGARESQLRRADTVANDDLAGSRLAVRHLLDLGHRRIAHVAGFGEVGRLRREGYEATMAEAGLAEHVLVEPCDMTEEGGYRAGIRLLAGAEPPTAVFVTNDLACIGVQDAAEELGLRVPGSISLVGYDNTYLVRLRHLWLTTVDAANQEVGRTVARVLTRRMGDPGRPPDTVLVAPRLEVRGSTGPR